MKVGTDLWKILLGFLTEESQAFSQGSRNVSHGPTLNRFLNQLCFNQYKRPVLRQWLHKKAEYAVEAFVFEIPKLNNNQRKLNDEQKFNAEDFVSCGRELVLRHWKMKWFCVVVVCFFVFSAKAYFCAKAMNTRPIYLNTWTYLTSGNSLLLSAPASVIILERGRFNMPRIYQGACMPWRYINTVKTLLTRKMLWNIAGRE